MKRIHISPVGFLGFCLESQSQEEFIGVTVDCRQRKNEPFHHKISTDFSC